MAAEHAPPPRNATFQLPLALDTPWQELRWRWSAVMPTPEDPAHVVELSARTEIGYVFVGFSCACTGAETRLTLDLLACDCLRLAPEGVCHECVERLTAIAWRHYLHGVHYLDAKAAGLGDEHDAVFARMFATQPKGPPWSGLAVLQSRLLALLDPVVLTMLRRVHPGIRNTLYPHLAPPQEGYEVVGALFQSRPLLLALVARKGLFPGDLRHDPWPAIHACRRARDLERIVVNALAMPPERARSLVHLARILPTDVGPAALSIVGALAIPPSDVPSVLDDRRTWIETVKRVTCALDGGEDDPVWKDDIAAHASRHYAAMAALSDEALSDYAWVTGCLGVAPPRTLNAAALSDWIEAHRALAERINADFEPDANVAAARMPADWPAPPWPAGAHGEASFRPIHTRAALLDESNVMHHCVWTYGADIARGELALYHVVHPTGPSTLMLERERSGRWRMSQHRGPCNATVSPEAAAAVAQWLAERGVALE